MAFLAPETDLEQGFTAPETDVADGWEAPASDVVDDRDSIPTLRIPQASMDSLPLVAGSRENGNPQLNISPDLVSTPEEKSRVSGYLDNGGEFGLWKRPEPLQPVVDPVQESLRGLPTPVQEPVSRLQEARRSEDEFLRNIVTKPLIQYLPDNIKREMDYQMFPHGKPKNSAALGVLQGLGGLAESFTSPIGLATLNMGGLPKAAQRAVSLAFAYDMARQTPELARELGAEMGKNEQDRDTTKIAELITSGAANTLFSALSASHGLAPGHPEPTRMSYEQKVKFVQDNLGRALEGKDVAELPETKQPGTETDAEFFGQRPTDKLNFIAPKADVVSTIKPTEIDSKSIVEPNATAQDEILAQIESNRVPSSTPKPTEQTETATAPENTPATKADLMALADFIENGGANPFAPKTSESRPAGTTDEVQPSQPASATATPASPVASASARQEALGAGRGETKPSGQIVSAPTAPRKPKLVSIRSQANEFAKLVADNAHTHQWASGQMLDDLHMPSAGNENIGTLGIKGNIARGKAKAIALRNAAGDLGLNPEQMGNLAYRAKNLPKLKEFIGKRDNFDAATKYDEAKIDLPVEELKVGDVLDVDGEKVTVTGVGRDFVQLQDGRKFGKQTVSNGETLYVEGYEPNTRHAAGDYKPFHSSAAEALSEAENFKPDGQLLRGFRPDPVVLGKRGMRIFYEASKLREQINNLQFDLKTKAAQGDIFMGDQTHRNLVGRINQANGHYLARMRQLAEIEAQQSDLFADKTTTAPDVSDKRGQLAQREELKRRGEARLLGGEGAQQRDLGISGQGSLFAKGNGRGLTVEQATAAITSHLGADKLPSGIRVVRDEKATWGARIEWRNKITVNAAQISTLERARAVIMEEGLHGVWHDPAVQRAWASIKDLVTAEEMKAEFAKRKAQGLPTDKATIREEAAIARLLNMDAGKGVIAKFYDAIRAAFKRVFGIDLPATDRQALKDAAMEFLRGREDWQGAKGDLKEAFAAGDVSKDWQTQKADVDAAERRLKDAISQVSTRPDGMSKADAIKAKNLAAAEYRNLHGDLMRSPDYANHLLTREKEVHRQLQALLEPAGVTPTPDFMLGREEKIRGALSETEIARVQKLDDEWQRLRREIEDMPKKLVSAAYDKLYPPQPTTGATRADIPSDWLKATLGDRKPVEDVKDITTTADKVRDAVTSLPDNAREAYKGAAKFTKQLGNRFTTIPNRDTMAVGKDAADNKATIFSKQVGNVVLHELNRSFGLDIHTRNERREHALTMAIEAGDPATLKLMRDTIDESQHRNSKWAKQALAAIDYAEKHWDRFEPARQLYQKITDAQVASEQASGIATLHREGGYVFHLQDVMDNWQHLDVGGASGGGAASPFKHIRDHATYADAIANGVSPKTLNAVDLLQRRIALGQKLINYRAWQAGLKHYIDPTTKLPLAAEVETRIRADGTQIDNAPSGYKIVQFAGQKMAIHKGYTGLFEALTGDSYFRKNEAGALLMKGMTTAKHSMLLFDTFHLGRLAYWNAITRGAGEGGLTLLPGNPFSFKKGLTLLDMTNADIRKMGQTGELPSGMAEKLIAQRGTLDKLINAGMNVGGVGDNIYSDWVQKLPIAGTFNRWLFEKFQRGAMAEVGLMEFERQKSMHPEWTDEQVARAVAKAVNTRFGNLNSQSFLRMNFGKTGEDLARIAFLAPQWNESLIRSEIGAVKDAGAFVKGAALGKLHVGTLGRAVATAFIGQFIANQIINLYTRGMPTWENPEEGVDAKLSAWIPDKIGTSSGFFLNPMTLPAEMSHLVHKGYERTGRLDKALIEATTSRFSSLGRFLETLYTGHNREGEVANSTGERLMLAVKEAAPTPISGGAIVRAGKQLITGKPEEKYPGQFQRQAMQTFGVKPDSAPSPESRIYNLARKFNQEHGVPDREENYHRPYAQLDAAIKVGNLDKAKRELANLLETREAKTIQSRYKAREAGRFTGKGSKDEPDSREGQFYSALTPEQKGQYDRAIAERERIAAVVQSLLESE